MILCRSVLILSLIGSLGICPPVLAQQPFSLSPKPADASDNDEHPPAGQAQETLKLQAEKFGIPRPLLFRQMQPQVYPKYEAKTKSLETSMKAMSEYLGSLEGSPPDLQRISAFNSEVKLDWSSLQGKIQPGEKSYRTYQLMQTVVQELDALTEYWVTKNEVARPFRGTAEEDAQDQAIIDSRMKKVKTALAELQKFEETKQAMEQEEPYR